MSRHWSCLALSVSFGMAASIFADDLASPTPHLPSPLPYATKADDRVEADLPPTPLDPSSINDGAELPATMVSQSTTYATPVQGTATWEP